MPILKETAKHETSFVVISKDEYDSMQATIETLGDKEIMKQIMKSKEDIKEGRIKEWDVFVKEL